MVKLKFLKMIEYFTPFGFWLLNDQLKKGVEKLRNYIRYSKEERKKILDAKDHYFRGKYDDALVVTKSLLEKRPQHPRFLIFKAMIFNAQDKYNDAILYASHALGFAETKDQRIKCLSLIAGASYSRFCKNSSCEDLAQAIKHINLLNQDFQEPLIALANGIKFNLATLQTSRESFNFQEQEEQAKIYAQKFIDKSLKQFRLKSDLVRDYSSLITPYIQRGIADVDDKNFWNNVLFTLDKMEKKRIGKMNLLSSHLIAKSLKMILIAVSFVLLSAAKAHAMVGGGCVISIIDVF